MKRSTSGWNPTAADGLQQILARQIGGVMPVMGSVRLRRRRGSRRFLTAMPQSLRSCHQLFAGRRRARLSAMVEYQCRAGSDGRRAAGDERALYFGPASTAPFCRQPELPARSQITPQSVEMAGTPGLLPLRVSRAVPDSPCRRRLAAGLEQAQSAARRCGSRWRRCPNPRACRLT